jgi:para-nitrobenzyl esterase
MVWLHGGGFADGSSIEQVAYDGENLSKRGDVVVVTINHRLNILGFLDMSSYGEKYANSVNAGMADIVEALRWIHNNISSFGGDPDNVTIFGQSGGGGKVGTLLNIPAAAGLFHRAILMSGVISTLAQGEIDHRPLIDGIMKELNIPADQVELLEEVPYEILIRAYNKVNSDLAEHGFKNGWIPVANDWYLGDPMVVGFSDYAKTVPTMAGTVIAEFSTRNNLEVENRMTEEDKVAAITEKYGEDAPRIIELFKASYPGDDIQTILKIDRLFRPCTVDYIAKKAEESTAPAYLYQFTTTFDIKGGAPAWHCSDIPFVFYNTSLVPSADIENVTEKLEEEMAGAWVSFAYSGNPNHNGMVKWENYTAENKATMVFDANTRCVHDLDSEILEIVERHSNGGTLKDIMVTTAKSNKDTGASKREWIY